MSSFLVIISEKEDISSHMCVSVCMSDSALRMVPLGIRGLTFTHSKLTIETVEKGVKYVQG